MDEAFALLGPDDIGAVRQDELVGDTNGFMADVVGVPVIYATSIPWRLQRSRRQMLNSRSAGNWATSRGRWSRSSME